jgi:hypothetical protein
MDRDMMDDLDMDDLHGYDDFDDEEFELEEYKEVVDDNYLNNELKNISPVDEGISDSVENNDDHLVTITSKIDLQRGFEVTTINLENLIDDKNSSK